MKTAHESEPITIYNCLLMGVLKMIMDDGGTAKQCTK